MNHVITETRTVYYAAQGPRRKTRLTRIAAYMDAAWFAWRRKHWPYGCGCDAEVGWYCGYHREDADAVILSNRRRVLMSRLARWLMWADGKPSKAKRLQVSYRKPRWW